MKRPLYDLKLIEERTRSRYGRGQRVSQDLTAGYLSKLILGQRRARCSSRRPSEGGGRKGGKREEGRQTRANGKGRAVVRTFCYDVLTQGPKVIKFHIGPSWTDALGTRRRPRYSPQIPQTIASSCCCWSYRLRTT